MSNEENKEQEAAATNEEATPTVLETVAEAVGEAVGTVENAAESVTETVSEAAETVTETVSAASSAVTNLFGGQEEAAGDAGRNERKSRIGIVTSNKMDKTIAVEIQRRLQHPIYGKYVKKSKKLIAHDENNECSIGDTVRITETRPLSRRKRWRLVTIIEKAK